MAKINPVHNDFIMSVVLRFPDEKADALLVEMVETEMRDRLSQHRESGKRGWHGPNCTNEQLLEMLKNNLNKGDMVDVINLAAMIHARTLLYGTTA